MTVLDAFGCSAPDLETERILVEKQAPMARQARPRPYSARAGEYRFKLMSGTSVYVRVPTTPSGRERSGIGLWKLRINADGESWRYARDISTVVDCIRWRSEKPG